MIFEALARLLGELFVGVQLRRSRFLRRVFWWAAGVAVMLTLVLALV